MPLEEFKQGGFLPEGKANITGGKELFDLLDSFDLTHNEKTEIVDAGIPIIEAALEKNVPELDHDKYPWADNLYGKDRKIKHIRDSITFKSGQRINGGTNIGFTAQAGPVARWVNWGTYRQAPQFFMERTWKEIDFDSVFKKQEMKAREIIERKQN